MLTKIRYSFYAKPGDQIWVQITNADEHNVLGIRVED